MVDTAVNATMETQEKPKMNEQEINLPFLKGRIVQKYRPPQTHFSHLR